MYLLVFTCTVHDCFTASLLHVPGMQPLFFFGPSYLCFRSQLLSSEPVMHSVGWNGGYGMGGMLVIPTPGMHIPAGSHGVPIYGVRSHSQSPTWQSSPFQQPGSNGSHVSASARSPRHQPSSSESSSSSLRGQNSLFAEPQGQPPWPPGGGAHFPITGNQLNAVNSYSQVYLCKESLCPQNQPRCHPSMYPLSIITLPHTDM